MGKMLIQMIGAMVSYYANFIGTNYNKWWFLVVTWACIYLLFFLIVRIKRERLPFLRHYRILQGVIMAPLIINFILTSRFCVLWATTSYYSTQKTEFIYLLTSFTCMVIPIFGFSMLRKQLSPDNLKQIVSHPLTKNEEKKFIRKAKDGFYELKICLLLPVLGFLFLFLYTYKPHNLVSFILDNSGSMQDEIEFGKSTLSKTIMELHLNNDLIISWLTEKSPKTTFEEILAEKDYAKLEGEHKFFTDKRAAIQYLSTIQLIGGTPLCEVIQSNLLYAKAFSRNQTYKQHMLIVITDGDEKYLKGDNYKLDNFLCLSPEFEEFYHEVSLINLGGQLDNEFFTKAQDCGYYIEENGIDKNSYADALRFILTRFKNDWCFIIWLSIVYALPALIALFIPPKRY